MRKDTDTQPEAIGSRSPAFQFYPKDFLTDENVRLMSMQERGIYITLMAMCWIESTLPADTKILARLISMPVKQFHRLWKAIEPCFDVDPLNPDRIIHQRLDKERVKQILYRRRQSDRGKASAEKRRAVEPEASNAVSTLVQQEIRKEPQPQTNSSISSSFAFASSDQKKERASEPDVMRAGNFIERYKALHLQLRKGAHYLGKPTFDFQEALQLVGVYDDTRLDKLAYVWLNTDHDFAQNGTRSIAKFRSMCSWCEEKLIDWELAHGPLQVELVAS